MKKFNKGLSLIEVILVVILLGIISAAIVPLVQIGLTSFIKLYPATEAVLDGDTALEKIAYDIQKMPTTSKYSIYPASGGNGQKKDFLAFAINNPGVDMSKTTTTGPDPARYITTLRSCSFSKNPAEVVSYQLIGKDILRTTYIFNTECPATGLPTVGKSEILATNISKLIFIYYDQEGKPLSYNLSSNLAPVNYLCPAVYRYETIKYITIQIISNGHTFTETVQLNNYDPGFYADYYLKFKQAYCSSTTQ